jgi:hypothetical protein
MAGAIGLWLNLLTQRRHSDVESITMCIRMVALVSLLLACVGVAHSQADRAVNSGIQGTVMVSPSRPGPIRAGSDTPNAAPLSNATFRVTSKEGVVTAFATDAQGHFSVSLKPGHYSVVLAEKRFPRGCGPFEIDVDAGMIEVEWHCDSGMR